MQEVGGAVEWINQPAMLTVLGFDLTRFFHQEAEIRAGAAQFRVDDLFRFAVGLADVVAGAFKGNLKVLDFAEVARKAAAGLHSGLYHDIEKG